MFKSLRAKLGSSKNTPAVGAVIMASGPIADGKGIARVVFTLKEEARDDPVFLSRVQAAVLRSGGDGPTTPDEEYVASIVETPLKFDCEVRWRLPSSVSFGVPCYLVETLLDFNILPDPYLANDLNQGLLPGTVAPGEKGEFVVMPYDVEGVERRHRSRIEKMLACGRKVPAVLVQANVALYEPGDRDLPALALFTFSKDLPDRTRSLFRLGALMGELKERMPRTPAEQLLAEMTSANEAGWRYHRRWRLPLELTEGVPFYAADIWIKRNFLKAGHLTRNEVGVPCVAEVGDQGGIELLHHEVVSKRR